MANMVRIEAWAVKDKTAGHLSSVKTVAKVVVRNEKGQFHGATNFRGSVINS